MLEAAQEALTALLQPERLQWLLLGVGIGLIIGALPGMGGIAGMSVLIPFVFGMDPYSGIALLVGMMAVTSTSDTFMSVMMGVPGSSSSQATILDGYPMTRRGEGARALGAAFLASMLGGLVGAVALFALLPIARPIVLSLKAPELLMLALLGVSMVAVLSRHAPLAGLVSACLGLLVSSIGAAPAGGERFMFGWEYLYGGVSITLVALGLFAIPEFLDLVVEGRSIARRPAGNVQFGRGLLTGAMDTLRRLWLVLWGGLLGMVFGLLPGIGGSVSQWIVYGSTSQLARKDRHKFGKGDVRGVIAPESANNSGDAGTLVPTLLFGIPGNGTTAVLLGGLVLLGVSVGPDMVSDRNLPFLLTVTWTLAIANVVAAACCFLAARYIVRLSLVPSRVFVPFLFVLVIVAAYQNSQLWGDIVVLFGLGAVGWVMKRLGWPRPPLLIGFVLGTIVERYLRISIDRYGWEVLSRPMVIVLAVVIAALLVLGLRRPRRHRPTTTSLREGQPA